MPDRQHPLEIIGLYAGVAGGKSTIARLFAELGAVVLDADKFAHEALADADVKARIAERFGADVIAADGTIDRRVLADRVFGDNPRTVDHSLIPTAVFSQPELGTVGMTQDQAEAECPNLDIYKTEFRAMKHAFPGRDERMLMKLIVNADSGKVLGVHLCGDGAGELIQALGIAVSMGATKADFDNTIAVHPTAAEELVTMRTPAVRIREPDHPDNMLDVGLTPRV